MTENLQLYDQVEFSRKNIKDSPTYIGFICAIEQMYKNRGAPEWGTEPQHFISLNDFSDYEKILTRAWVIIGKDDHLYTIEELLYDSSGGLDRYSILEYNKKYSSLDKSCIVDKHFISGLLVYSGGFVIRKRV